VLLFIPYTVWVLSILALRGALNGTQITLVIILGIVLHVPVAALFVVPYLRWREARKADTIAAG
jgi:putative effector of murein hydrolase LrgA (UPF0299 family)